MRVTAPNSHVHVLGQPIKINVRPDPAEVGATASPVPVHLVRTTEQMWFRYDPKHVNMT